MDAHWIGYANGRHTFVHRPHRSVSLPAFLLITGYTVAATNDHLIRSYGMCRRSKACGCGRSKSNSSDSCCIKSVITGAVTSVGTMCWAEQSFSITTRWSADWNGTEDEGFMEGRQGGDLDHGTGRDTRVTEAGGAFYLSIYLFSLPEQLWNARRGEREQRRSENRWLQCIWVLHTRSHSPQTWPESGFSVTAVRTARSHRKQPGARSQRLWAINQNLEFGGSTWSLRCSQKTST